MGVLKIRHFLKMTHIVSWRLCCCSLFCFAQETHHHVNKARIKIYINPFDAFEALDLQKPDQQPYFLILLIVSVHDFDILTLHCEYCMYTRRLLLSSFAPILAPLVVYTVSSDICVLHLFVFIQNTCELSTNITLHIQERRYFP